jgi:hypothetical protein
MKAAGAAANANTRKHSKQSIHTINKHSNKKSSNSKHPPIPLTSTTIGRHLLSYGMVDDLPP